MAPTLLSPRSAIALFFTLLLHVQLTLAQYTAFWTVTTNYMISSTVSTYTYRATSLDLYTRATTRTIKKGATPTGSIYSTSTSTDSYNDVKYVRNYYAAGAVADGDLVTPTSSDFDDFYSTTNTYYYMPVTFTAPLYCSSQFTHVTSVSVNIPSAVTDQISVLSTQAGTPSTYATYIRQYVTHHLSANAAPFTTTSNGIWRYYITSCSSPSAARTGTTTRRTTTVGGGGSSRGSGNTDWTVCSWYTGCTSLKTWVIVIATILPTIFALGFLESWFWFRRLMLGKAALRFGTICWIFLSLWVACFTRKAGSRSKEDQLLLREKWNAMSGRTAFKLWWKWGFRHAYPTELLGTYSKTTVGVPGIDSTNKGAPGTAPGTASNGDVPQMQQQAPVYYQPGQVPQQYGPQYQYPPQFPQQQYPQGQPGQASYSVVSPVSSTVPTAVPTPQPTNAQPNDLPQQQHQHTQYYDPPSASVPATTPTPPAQAPAQAQAPTIPALAPQQPIELPQQAGPPPAQQPKP